MVFYEDLQVLRSTLCVREDLLNSQKKKKFYWMLLFGLINRDYVY